MWSGGQRRHAGAQEKTRRRERTLASFRIESGRSLSKPPLLPTPLCIFVWGRARARETERESERTRMRAQYVFSNPPCPPLHAWLMQTAPPCGDSQSSHFVRLMCCSASAYQPNDGHIRGKMDILGAREMASKPSIRLCGWQIWQSDEACEEREGGRMKRTSFAAKDRRPAASACALF